MDQTKSAVKTEGKKTAVAPAWHPLDDLRREVDRLFDDFGGGWLRPFRPSLPTLDLLRGGMAWNTPAVDIVEKDKSFEITAELPGLDEENIEVTLRNGNLVIKGEKQEEQEETSKDYHLKERQFGSFERSFALPEGVDPDKIEAHFKRGILTVSLPKAAKALKPEKKIAISSRG